MDRQMFRQGGAAFPDMNNDGKTTYADILIGRGVEFKQEGGIAGMMAAPGMAGAMAAQSDMPTEAVGQAAGAIDPSILEGMLAEVAGNIENMDAAEDFESVMNAMRGDNATIEERRDELAGVVGPEDAAQTPESVLALVQPVMQLASIDQGIGGLAQEEMTEPVEGAMAEGIMSTVAPPPQEAAPMPPAGMGGPPPVNFNQGGLVRRGDNQPVQYYEPGGEVTQFFGPRIGISPDQSALLRQQIDYENMAKELAAAKALKAPEVSSLSDVFGEKKELYRTILGDTEGDMEERKRLTQAQMLFDVANTALAFAAPMEGERSGLSPAERLAMAARSTQLPQMIGARAQAQLEAEQAAKREGRTLDLAALQAAEKQVETDKATRAAYLQKQMELRAKTTKLGEGEVLVNSAGEVIAEGPSKSFTLGPGDLRLNAQGQVIASGSDRTWTLSAGQKVVNKDGEVVAEGEGTRTVLSTGQIVVDANGKQLAKGGEPDVKGIPRDIYNSLPKKTRDLIILGNPSVNGVPASIFAQLDRDDQNVIMGLTENNVKGIPMPLYEGLSDDDKRKVLLGAQSDEPLIKGIPKSVYDKLPDALQTQILGGMVTLAEGHKVVDLKTGKTVAEGADKTITLSPGQVVMDRTGTVLAEGPAKELVDDVVKYISDPTRIDAYANNRLGDKTAEFEQQILDYVSKPSRVWDGEGYVAGDAPRLSKQLMAAIQARSAAGLPSILDQLPSSVITPVKKVSEDAGEDEGSVVTTVPDDITSPEFNSLLFAEDGSVNLNSPAWDKIPTNIVDKELNYPGSTGIASGYQRFKNFFAENLRELGGSGLTEEGKKLSRADSDLITLRNELLTYSTSGGMVGDSDRILKMVQEQLMDETNKLTPGMFTTDETALSKLVSVEEKLAANLQVLAQRVPEYGGQRGAFSEKQVIQARERLGMLKNLIAEVRTMRTIYEKALNAGALGLNPTQRKAAKDWLKGNREGQ